MDLALFFEKRSKLFWGLVGGGMVVLLGVLDFLTDFELAFSLFYLVPISVVTWFAGRGFGLLLSTASAAAWLVAEVASGNIASNIPVDIWNILARLSIFVFVAVLLSVLRDTLKVNQELARKDYVTGAVSIQYFYELAQREINRSQRNGHPFSVAYIDLDNFKEVNDRFGHIIGDKVLRAVASNVLTQIRKIDTFARLGGDEFTLLLPETGADAAQEAVSRILISLFEEMKTNQWPVTFSIGVVTYNRPPKSVDEMVKLADDAMYSVKTTTKNGISYRICPEAAGA